MAVGRIVIGEFQDEDEASRFAAHYADKAPRSVVHGP